MPDSLRVAPTADALARDVTRLARHSPADRSVLRHSLGKSPKDVALGVHRIVVPFLPGGNATNEAEERAYYMVAALIASQPRNARDQTGTSRAPASNTDRTPSRQEAPAEPRPPRGQRRQNLGYSLAQAAHKSEADKSKNLGDRLEFLARQDADGLYRHLPRLILHLRGDQIGIDWGVLIRDLTRWADDPRQVAKEWAQSFYRTSEQLINAKKRKSEPATDGPDLEETPS